MTKNKIIDFASVFVLGITILLFGLALIENGLTQAVLLETGFFLVSAKIVIGNYQNKIAIQKLETKLDELIRK